MENSQRPTGLFRAVELLEAMIDEAKESRAGLAVSEARATAYRRNRAGDDADCRHWDMLTFETQVLERVRTALIEAAHSDPTSPGTTLIEMKLGQG